MRSAFIRVLVGAARRDERVFLLTGDLGFTVLEPFAQEFPDRFINVGVAEQNMIGVAAGLAWCGKIPFVYSIANFPTLRCLEHIRLDVCYPKTNVKIVAIGGGFAYGPLGVSHHGTEDLAILRSLPNMTILAPGDPIEAELCTNAAVTLKGPVYLRLGKAGEPKVYSQPPEFRIGQAILVRPGNDITLIAIGGILYNTVQASYLLAAEKIDARVISVPTLKPLDEKSILQAAKETKAIFTVEEHTVIGGLGSAVAELLSEEGLQGIFFKRLGIPDTFAPSVASQEYLRKMFELSPEGIAQAVLTSKCLN